MNNDFISRSELKNHKFVGNKFVQIGGRTNGKTLENINRAYQQGWNDAIDAIIENAPAVPEKSQGDLISREALKKALIEAHINRTLSFDIATFGCVMNTIDNAPTVEPCKDCEDKRQAEYIRHGSSWHELQSLRKFKEEHERPQGEWGKWVISEIRCPNCLEYFQTDCYSTEELKKCPNCGVEMKGGAE